MTEKKDDFVTWGLLGAAGAAVLSLVLGALGGSNMNKGVNSYQSTASYSPPANPGCGCNAGRSS